MPLYNECLTQRVDSRNEGGQKDENVATNSKCYDSEYASTNDITVTIPPYSPKYLFVLVV
jgi:hypothetical protein